MRPVPAARRPAAPPALAPAAALIAILAAPLATPGAALAQGAAPSRPAAGPQRLGTFGDWTAATHQENGRTVCYAFVRGGRSEGATPRRDGTLLTVTHRPEGRAQVAARVGYAYPAGAEPVGRVGTTDLPFYTSQDTAFARDGRAVTAAFARGRALVLRGPGPGGRGTASDTFPLAGFSQALEAIDRACPAPGAPAAPARRR